MNSIRVGFAMCGSFCTFSQVIPQLEKLVESGAQVTPIMSEAAYYTDTRFGNSIDFVNKIEHICNRSIIHSIKDAEPIGPKKLLDILIIEPCTGNTLSKLAKGITDTPVTMAAKANLRNDKPVLIAVSTNDGLSASAENIGILQNRKNVFFVPYGQDDPYKKPCSLVADFSQTIQAMHFALDKQQLQPILYK